MTRRDFVKLVTAGSSLTIPGIGFPSIILGKNRKPNILLVHTDQHNADVLQCYGNTIISSPGTNEIAKEGVVFGQCYSPNPVCVPARMSMLTGLYSTNCRVYKNSSVLDSNIATIPHILAEEGYRTCLVGKMHFIGMDQLHGYQERPFYGEVYTHRASRAFNHPREEIAWADEYQKLYTLDVQKKYFPKRPPYGLVLKDLHPFDNIPSGKRQEDRVTIRALQWAKRFRESTSKQPYFLTASYMKPHGPWDIPTKYYQLYKDRMVLPDIPGEFSEHLPGYIDKYYKKMRMDLVTDEDILRGRAFYYGSVHYVEDQIKILLNGLKELGMLDNTIIIYIADHGEQLGDHWLWAKMTFFEYSARVPLIINYPGYIPNGIRRNEICNLVDLLPTILEAVGLRLPYKHEKIDGKSLWPLVLGRKIPWQNTTFSELFGGRYNKKFARMIRKDNWKYNYLHGSSDELFNLKTDPREYHNLASESQYKDIVQELRMLVLKNFTEGRIAEIIEDVRRVKFNRHR